jgi:hypothetical protein
MIEVWLLHLTKRGIARKLETEIRPEKELNPNCSERPRSSNALFVCQKAVSKLHQAALGRRALWRVTARVSEAKQEVLFRCVIIETECGEVSDPARIQDMLVADQSK